MAILLVMLHHYAPDLDFPLFGHGVTLFFVLSGFFSTRQLLRSRARVGEGRITRARAIGGFHVRRYLRIFPVYFLVVGMAVAAALPYARDAFWWHLTFTSNWYILEHLEWIGPFSPFWSLAVLEQFYLLWPTILLCLPRRAMLPACGALVATAVLWRWHCYRDSLHTFYWLVHPFAGLDQLGVGALLAMAAEPQWERVQTTLRQIGLWVALPLAGYLMFVAERPPTGDFHAIYQPLLMSLVFAWLIDAVSRGLTGAAGALLGHAAARAGGRVSYSIFAFHEFTAYLIPPLWRPEVPEVLEHGWKPWVLIAGTCVLAGLVFATVEGPFLRLKRHFQA